MSCTNSNSFRFLITARCSLFCTFIFLTLKSAVGFWPFSDNTPTTPTLQFYPEPPDAYQNTLIYYTNLHPETSEKHVDSIRRFLNSYKINQQTNAYNCHFGSPPTPNTFCVFDLRSLEYCEGDFGFRKSSPCILLTMTKVTESIHANTSCNGCLNFRLRIGIQLHSTKAILQNFPIAIEQIPFQQCQKI